MHTILVVGAGKTSIYLLEYLLSNAQKYKWKVMVADNNLETIEDKIDGNPLGEAAVVDITDNSAREALVQRADIVISLVPPQFHILFAKDCLKYKKHLLTASYISPDVRELHQEAKEAGLMFMFEMGLDPGIDHMTAHQIIHGIQRVAAVITSFKSYAGGLVASESDSNPWHYKFSWNPKNIVLAGMDGARYLENGQVIDVPYKDLFAHPETGAKMDDVGPLVYYPNRDSLRYLELYDLPDIHTFIRATYRYKDFMQGWNILVQLGLTDPSDKVTAKTYAEWIRNKNGFATDRSLREQIADKLGISADNKHIDMVAWLGILEEKDIKPKKAKSADVLLDVLLSKWKLEPEDKDLVVMRHEVEYLHKGKKTLLTSTMALKGENSKYSAMAKTVGLPLAILTKLVLTKRIVLPLGVRIPNMPSVYKPVLAELQEHDITFVERIE